ncbi:recombination protein NinB [Silvimonas soli]|uniref:recombination protein NinB n=1 Tax=Silvimonas soli TaxID=2980100 RepID=UPI0024B37E03|nr:recombination protein NinB [Silvimonas soli]
MNRFFLRTEDIRFNALAAIHALQLDANRPLVVEIKEMTRNLDQNAKMWAVLTDIATQVDWYGQRLSKEDWKHMFTAQLQKLRVVPSIEGGGFVALGQSTSKMTVREMADLIELAQAFGSERGVKWGDESRIAQQWAESRRAA